MGVQAQWVSTRLLWWRNFQEAPTIFSQEGGPPTVALFMMTLRSITPLNHFLLGNISPMFRLRLSYKVILRVHVILCLYQQLKLFPPESGYTFHVYNHPSIHLHIHIAYSVLHRAKWIKIHGTMHVQKALCSGGRRMVSSLNSEKLKISWWLMMIMSSCVWLWNIPNIIMCMYLSLESYYSLSTLT